MPEDANMPLRTSEKEKHFQASVFDMRTSVQTWGSFVDSSGARWATTYLDRVAQVQYQDDEMYEVGMREGYGSWKQDLVLTSCIGQHSFPLLRKAIEFPGIVVKGLEVSGERQGYWAQYPMGLNWVPRSGFAQAGPG